MLWSCLVFVAVAALFAALEAVWPARRRSWWRRDVRTDAAYWVVTPIVSHTLVAIVVVGAVIVVALIGGIPIDEAHLRALVERSTWASELPLGLQVLLVLVVGDLLGYAAHVVLHRARLWRFHAIHHSATDLDWLASSRLHPVDDVVQRAAQLIPLILAGFDPAILTTYIPVLGVIAVVQHANVPWTFGPLRYVIVSPVFHAWHHTSETRGLDKNFAGLFPIWDLAFGTFYMPREERPQSLGVNDEVPDGIVAQLGWPFRRHQPITASTVGPRS